MHFQEQVLKKLTDFETSVSKKLEKLDSIDARLGGLEGRFDGLDARLGGLEGRFDGLEGRFGDLESVIHDAVLPELHKSEARFNIIEDKLFSLDSHVREHMVTKGEFNATKEELIGHIDFLARRSEAHDEERLATVERMDRMEHRIGIIERRPTSPL